MPKWFCLNPACSDENSDKHVFEDKTNTCPKCKSRQSVFLMSLIHMLVEDPNGTEVGMRGVTYKILCGAEKKQSIHHGLTGQASAVTCSKCKELLGDKAKEPVEFVVDGQVVPELGV